MQAEEVAPLVGGWVLLPLPCVICSSRALTACRAELPQHLEVLAFCHVPERAPASVYSQCLAKTLRLIIFPHKPYRPKYWLKCFPLFFTSLCVFREVEKCVKYSFGSINDRISVCHILLTCF